MRYFTHHATLSALQVPAVLIALSFCTASLAAPPKAAPKAGATKKPPVVKPQAVEAKPPPAPTPTPAPPEPAKPVVPAAAPVAAPVSPAADGLISNVFMDSDIKQALNDVANAAGVTIVCDSSVTGNISVELKSVTLEKALELIVTANGFCFKKMEGYYLVGSGAFDSPSFTTFAVSELVRPQYIKAAKMSELLSSTYEKYVRVSKDGDLLSLTAQPVLLSRIKADIAKFDVAPRQILLEAAIVEISSNASNDFGLTWNWNKFASPSAGAFSYAEAGANDVVNLKAIVASGRGKIKANPRIMALEGELAEITVGQDAFYAFTTGPANYPYTTLQSIKTGITLKMEAQLSDRDEITVHLEPEVSDAIGLTQSGYPVNTVRKASCTVRVRDGQTIAIGGLKQQSEQRSRNKVPILGDLPLIGVAFRQTRHSVVDSDVVILVTPHIVREGEAPITTQEWLPSTKK